MKLGRLGIRGRLTAVVTIVFLAVSLVAGWAIVRVVERRLVDNARSNAEALLDSYLSGVINNGPMIATADPGQPGAFFYLDADGNELTQREYVAAIVDMGPARNGGSEPATTVESSEQPADGAAPEPGDPGSVFAVSVDADVVGDVVEIDRGDDAIALVRRLRFLDDDGTELQVGVSTPLGPVHDTVRTLQTLVWITAPLLAIAVAVVTSLAVGRTLRPVHAITRRTRDISGSNLSDRVPVPATGDDIAELATTMNDMLGRLDEAQQRQRRFIADASHELRSPVAASRAQLEVALAHPDRADWSATADAVLAEQTHLGRLIDDLLALSRLAEQGVGATATVRLDEIVAAEIERPRRATVRGDLDGAVTVVGNRSLLRRAVGNLVENADRHANGAVTVTLTTNGERALVHVDDDGGGVPSDDRERIFERFTRLDEGRNRDAGGAGLGLAIVRQVARSHGGTATCTEAPTGGARMTIELPIAR